MALTFFPVGRIAAAARVEVSDVFGAVRALKLDLWVCLPESGPGADDEFTGWVVAQYPHQTTDRFGADDTSGGLHVYDPARRAHGWVPAPVEPIPPAEMALVAADAQKLRDWIERWKFDASVPSSSATATNAADKAPSLTRARTYLHVIGALVLKLQEERKTRTVKREPAKVIPEVACDAAALAKQYRLANKMRDDVPGRFGLGDDTVAKTLRAGLAAILDDHYDPDPR